jgi:hypothetical protein
VWGAVQVCSAVCGVQEGVGGCARVFSCVWSAGRCEELCTCVQLCLECREGVGGRARVCCCVWSAGRV